MRAGCWFSEDAAEYVRAFFRKFLCHSKGQWAGRPFELLEWQWRDVVGPLFGWMRPDGTRRFRTAYIEVPKKNGKSALCSGLSLYLLVGDGEPGAEVYAAAADRAQAGIVFGEAANMIEASRELSGRLEVVRSTKHIVYPKTLSSYKALSADVPTKEGLNIHGLIFDELHAQRTRTMWDTLRYGGAARRQPLLIAITTAGWDRDSICFEQHTYAEQILHGTVRDDAFFAYIRAAGPKDDWKAERTWKKANPSFGVTLNADDFASDCREAQQAPTKENAFKRYRLNLWTEQAERWIVMDKWRACGAADPAAWRAEAFRRLAGQECTGGLDLGSTSDLTAFVLLFGNRETGYDLMPWFWCPHDGAQRKHATYREQYLAWARDGFLKLTEGDIADYEAIRADIVSQCRLFQVRDIGIDMLFQGAPVCNALREDGLNMIAFGQGFLSMAAPTKELEELYLSGKIRHGSNPVLSWMAANAVVKTDPAGNMKPCKPDKHSPLKIDGIVAAIMALGRNMVPAEKPKVSKYRSAGLVRV